jgi:hypothetical protein
VWAGGNAPAQTRFLQGEPVEEVYWLWRRVADGAQAMTRRITGQVDIDDPACPLDATFTQEQTATGPCYGPLSFSEGINFSLQIQNRPPAISADGRRVAFMTAVTPRNVLTSSGKFDVFVTDMTDGVSRKQGTVELTRDTGDFNDVTAGDIETIALSPDGRWLALTTVRTQFILPSPVMVGDAAQSVGETEIYVVDLKRNEIERAVRSATGGEVDRSAVGPASLSTDGSVLAFSSNATNLIAGDSNNNADAFAAKRVSDAPAEVAQDSVEALGGAVTGTARVKKRISLGVTRMPGGRLRLSVHVPEAGELSVRATASLPRHRRARRSRTRTLARAKTKARAAGTQTLVLRLSQRYLAQIASRRRIAVRLLVTFSPTQRGEALRVERKVMLKR